MEKKPYTGPERRRFVRIEHSTPLAYKVCKKETISKLLEGYTANVSQLGLLCMIKDHVNVGDFLWLSFDIDTLHICQDVEKKCLIYQNGIIGQVVRVERGDESHFKVGVSFLTREEKKAYTGMGDINSEN
jgi:hypothetical protein